MVTFVNAKINLGLNIISRRSDGYHLLETIFYPIGIYNGTPENPDKFSDILEVDILPDSEVNNQYKFLGRHIDCPPEKNLVWLATELFTEKIGAHFHVALYKALPDGAGLGGGSADASFTLKTLNTLCGNPLSEQDLLELALSLGADCPFFILNRPVFGEGVGEILTPVTPHLDGMWTLIIKPNISVSTKEAFSGITPAYPEINLREIYKKPVDQWRELMSNDFERTLFAIHPELSKIKNFLYESGALYAQMSGSGSSIFGIFSNQEEARICSGKSQQNFNNIHNYLCKL